MVLATLCSHDFFLCFGDAYEALDRYETWRPPQHERTALEHTLGPTGS